MDACDEDEGGTDGAEEDNEEERGDTGDDTCRDEYGNPVLGVMGVVRTNGAGMVSCDVESVVDGKNATATQDCAMVSNVALMQEH